MRDTLPSGTYLRNVSSSPAGADGTTDEIIDVAEANESSADPAPQQQVVADWAIRDACAGMLTSYPPPGSYVSMATPVVLISLFTRFNGIFGPSSRNRRFPVPSTIGMTQRS